MRPRKQRVQVVDPHDPVPLKRVTPRRSIQIVFWGLRVYIALMVVLVIIGFFHGVR